MLFITNLATDMGGSTSNMSDCKITKIDFFKCVVVLTLIVTVIATITLGVFFQKDQSYLSDIQPLGISSETFDFIVVGLGAGGSALAARLSEIPNWKILAIDGGLEENVNTSFAIEDFPLWKPFSSPQDPGFVTIPQSFANNRIIYLPRFSGLGGTTRLYGGIAVRPSATMLNQWPKGWQFDDLLPYYKKLEDHYCYYYEPDVTGISNDTCFQYHGKNGPMQVNTMVFDEMCPFEQLFFPFCNDTKELWGGWNPDLNAANNFGCSFFQRFFNRSSNNRANVEATADLETGFHYLSTAINRSNLRIREGYKVTKIIFDSSQTPPKARGILVSTPEGIKVIYANSEVILAGGSISTPHLLQVSGVGDPKDLAAGNIPLLAPNAFVGKNLQDHVSIPMIFQMKSNASIIPNTSSGTFSNANKQKGFLLQINTSDTGIVDMQIYFTYKNKHSPDKFLNELPRNCRQGSEGIKENPPEYTLRLILQNATFRGTIKAMSSSIFDRPLLDLGWNSITDYEINAFNVTIQAIRNIIKKSNVPGGWGDLILDEVFPGLATPLESFLQSNLESALHPVTTCQIGTCTDENLRVINTTNLRICDASSFGGQIDANPVMTIFAIAEKLADMIKLQYQGDPNAGEVIAPGASTVSSKRIFIDHSVNFN